MSRITIFIIVMLLGAGGATYVLRRSVKLQDNAASTSQTASQQSSIEATKSTTEKEFEQYKGEDYDRIFMSNMVEHHRGAIDMAKLAQTNAKHQELKDMAEDIIISQSNEQGQMIGYQKAWGYPASSGEMMEDHSAMGMATDMDTMTASLQGKTGDEFDEAFLAAMIEHHESAVAMSRPAAQNAFHQEIKDIARAIIEAQDAEIAQMRAWQVEWGYES